MPPEHHHGDHQPDQRDQVPHASRLDALLAAQGGAIVEVNAGPSLLMHLKPAEGKPRPVGKAIVDNLFPAGQTGRIPIVGICGSQGKSALARLIGAPPGYVGYEEGGYLTEMVRRKPYSVILLDEVEKAHPDVFNVLLQVLDDGRMTDGQGRTVDFKNTVIVMTSNLGSQMIQQMSGDDYQIIKLAVMGEVKTYFRPEFINRIDEVIVFHALDAKHIQSIAKIQLRNLENRLAKMEIHLEISEAALAKIAEAGFDPVFGARPLKRAIQTQIENPLAKELLEGHFAAKDTIHVDCEDETITFTKSS